MRECHSGGGDCTSDEHTKWAEITSPEFATLCGATWRSLVLSHCTRSLARPAVQSRNRWSTILLCLRTEDGNWWRRGRERGSRTRVGWVQGILTPTRCPKVHHRRRSSLSRWDRCLVCRHPRVGEGTVPISRVTGHHSDVLVLGVSRSGNVPDGLVDVETTRQRQPHVRLTYRMATQPQPDVSRSGSSGTQIPRL
jgi:hypothetical protein